MMQSNDTKTLNLANDFEELMDKTQQRDGWVRQNSEDFGRKRKRMKTSD